MYKSTRAASAGGRRNFPCGAAGAICCSRAAALKRRGSLALVPACSLARRRRPKILGSSCRCRSRDDGSSCVRACSPPEMTPCSTPCSLCSAAASLHADLRELPTSARASGRPASRRLARPNQQPQARAFSCFCAERPFFWGAAHVPGAAGSKKYGPTSQGRGIACAALGPAL